MSQIIPPLKLDQVNNIPTQMQVGDTLNVVGNMTLNSNNINNVGNITATDIDVTGNATISGSLTGLTTPLSTAQGGTGEAGTFTGLRKANSASADTQATAGTDYTTPANITADLEAFSGSSNIVTVGTLASGTIPAANVVGFTAAVNALVPTADGTTISEAGLVLSLIVPAALGSSTATTQSPGDNSTKVATTAFDAASNAVTLAAAETYTRLTPGNVLTIMTEFN